MRRNLRRMLPVLMGGASSILPYTIDFSAESDGALPEPWTGATWAISSGVAANTPTEGDNLLTDGGLENWASPTNLTSWTEALAGTSTVNQDTDAGNIHGGSSAARLDIDASSSKANINQRVSTTLLPQHSWAVHRAFAKGSEAGKEALIYSDNQVPGGLVFATTPTYQEIGYILRIFFVVGGGAVFSHSNLAAASASIYYDDLSVKRITTSTLFATMETGRSDVTVKAGWNITNPTNLAGSIAGVVMNVDDPANPQNFVIAYHLGALNDLAIVKYVNGVSSYVMSSTSAPYSAGANVELRKSGTTYQAFYNGIQVGTDKTISDASIISNTIHGVFSTYGGNTLDSFFAE